MNEDSKTNNDQMSFGVIRSKCGPLFVATFVFIAILAFLLNKTQAHMNVTQRGGACPWYEDEKYNKPEILDNTPHFVVDTIFSKGILVVGVDKYQETFTLTKIK